MKNNSIVDYLGHKKYPGRTICFSVNEDKSLGSIIYFIMGRSENSQNRIFVQEGNVIKTKAYDESKVTDPSLIIYPVYKEIGDYKILTNGDQTQTIYEGLENGLVPSQALLSRDFEPDAPNFTPRISLSVNKEGYELNIIKANDEEGTASCHFNYLFPFKGGVGHCIHTYVDDGTPLPSFEGEPFRFSHEDGLRDKIWEAINPEFKISLVEVKIDLVKNEVKDVVIINKHEVR